MVWIHSLLLKLYLKLDLQNITVRLLFPRDQAKEVHSVAYCTTEQPLKRVQAVPL